MLGATTQTDEVLSYLLFGKVECVLQNQHNLRTIALLSPLSAYELMDMDLDRAST